MKIKQILAIKYIKTKIKLLSLLSSRKAAEEAFRIFSTPQKPPIDSTPSAFFYAEPLYMKMYGLKIKGYRWNKDKGKKILILHGFSSSAYKFNHFVAPLIEKGYEVIAFDAQAHGNSEGASINALEYSKLIEKIIKVYGPISGFIAHSFGGIALSLALEKTPHDENTKMVLIAPATETTSAIESAFGMLGIENKNVKDAFEKIIQEKSGHSSDWFSIRRAIKNIKADTLWIHDEEDTVTPLSDALKVKALHLPNVHFIITKGLGHRRIYRDKTIKNEVIDFL
jgi:alpha-beta hydrolase superfamily lysophospholipase